MHMRRNPALLAASVAVMLIAGERAHAQQLQAAVAHAQETGKPIFVMGSTET